MATFSSIWTPFRRPCLLRSEVEANIDAPQGKHASVSPRSNAHTSGAGAATRGGGAPDYRSITLDMPARLSPQCSGLRRGSVGAPPEHRTPSKQDRIRTQQALGICNSFDLDLIPTRGAPRGGSMSREASQESQGSPSSKQRRPKVEELQGMPLCGRGADIDLVGGRRCQGYVGRERSPMEMKTELACTSIEHSFRRRHFSAPPDTRSCEKFEHVMHAEGYASLLGRPEGTGKRSKQWITPTRRSRSQQPRRCWSPERPFHVESRNLNGALFSSCSPSLYGSASQDMVPGSAAEFDSFRFGAGASPLTTSSGIQSVALIAALREATQDVPAEAVWDSMLNAFESPERLSPDANPRDMQLLSSPANLSAVLAAVISKDDPSTTPRRTAAQRGGTPVKTGLQDERKMTPLGLRDPIRKNASEGSLVSISTAYGEEDRSTSKVGTSSTSITAASIESVSAISSPGSPCRRSRTCRTSNASRLSATGWLREEQRKASRRASWVA